jgi:hypothetical protein
VRWSPLTPIRVEFLLDGYVAAQAEVIDISSTGLGILSLEGFGPNEGYELRLACERGALRSVQVPTARVVWCESVGPGGRQRGGLRFDHRRAETRLALERLIQATCPIPTREAGTMPEQA